MEPVPDKTSRTNASVIDVYQCKRCRSRNTYIGDKPIYCPSCQETLYEEPESWIK